MTPTDQDKELREKVADALRTGYHGIAETKVINHIMKLITAEKLALLDKLAEQDNVDQDFSSRAIIEGQNYAQFNYRRAIQQEREAITKGVGL